MSGGFKFLKVLILYPISLIYGMVVGVRNFLFEIKIFQSKSYDLPVINVGNLAVGGTGKTPHVEYIISLLKKDYNTAVLSRGYKRKTKGYILSNGTDNAESIGDEPYQIKSKHPDIAVAVDENRRRGIENLLSDEEINTIILDDAFQHRKVSAGLNILLTDYNRLFTKDNFLPFGRLREHPHEHRRAHIIIVTKCPEYIKPIEKRIIDKEINMYPFQYLFFTHFEYGNLVNIFDAENQIDINQANEKTVLGVSAIANNKSFQDKLWNSFAEVTTMHYMDHHSYGKRDVQKIQSVFAKIEEDDKIIVTTEKDAVKLKSLSGWDESVKKKVYYLPIKVVFIGSDREENEFKKQIINYVKTNRRYSKLYKGKDLD